MNSQIALLLIVFLPAAGSFLLPLAGRLSEPLRNGLALAAVAASFLLSLALLPVVLGGESVAVRVPLALGVNFVLQADKLAVFMALISSFISAVIVLYSFGYISHYGHRDEYYLMVVLFLGAMMGLIFSGNLIQLYVFWEITSIACWRLIGFFRGKAQVVAADKAFLVTVFGAVLMLIGFVMLYQQAGSFDLDAIRQAFGRNPVPNLAVVLILCGILSKSATLPLHTWLPDAGVAPSPVTALLHAAVLVKIGVYVFARLFVATFHVDPVWHTAVPLIAGASALVSAGAALVETDLKRIIAYSTISQIGFIFLGLSLGVEVGIAGGLLYILMHGLAKAGLFLCAGIVEQKTGTKDITKLGGLIRTMPVTALSFLFCAFSVMGIPPFGGFFAKYMVFAGATAGDGLLIPAVFLLGAVLTILYLLRVFRQVFLGPQTFASAWEGAPVMVFSVALLAGLSLLGGLLVYYPSALVDSTVRQMLMVVQ